MLGSRHSFKLLPRAEIKKTIFADKLQKTNFSVAEFRPRAELEAQNRKRMFLKLAGIAGLGAVASLVFPKKADALVFGSTPSSNVVGVKNAANARVNPATEDTLGNIKTTTDKFQFDGSNNLKITGTLSGGTDPVGIKNADSVQINPVTEESLIYLRRLVRIAESLGTVDAAQRQRVAVDSAVISSGTITTVTTVGSVTNIGSWDARQMFQDQAHNVYANSIRRNLTFS